MASFLTNPRAVPGDFNTPAPGGARLRSLNSAGFLRTIAGCRPTIVPYHDGAGVEASIASISGINMKAEQDNLWNILFLVMEHTDADYSYTNSTGETVSGHITASLTEEEMNSFEYMAKITSPLLMETWSEGNALWNVELHRSSEVIRSLTAITMDNTGHKDEINASEYMAYPTFIGIDSSDIYATFKEYYKRGYHDAVMVYFNEISNRGDQPGEANVWGCGVRCYPGQIGWVQVIKLQGESPTVWETAPSSQHVYIHEFIHNVCGLFSHLGYPQPLYDADGGGEHGYSATQGLGQTSTLEENLLWGDWGKYYSDILCCRVMEGGGATGIPKDAWWRYKLRYFT